MLSKTFLLWPESHETRHAQGFKSNEDSSLLATVTKQLLNMIISQVKLINYDRLASYVKHAM
jgi:hypothetical protein